MAKSHTKRSRQARKHEREGIREELQENRICSDIGHVLQSEYPGWDWYIECRLFTGFATVRCLDLDGEYGFSVPLGKYLANPERHKVVIRAAGEILERYYQDRGARPERVVVEKKDVA